MTTQPEPALDIEQARELATDLVTELGLTPGDPDAVTTTLLHWLDMLGPDGIARVCLAAVPLVFGECLRPVPEDEWPANPIRFEREATDG